MVRRSTRPAAAAGGGTGSPVVSTVISPSSSAGASASAVRPPGTRARASRSVSPAAATSSKAPLVTGGSWPSRAANRGLNEDMCSGNRRGVGQAITRTDEATLDVASPERARAWRRAAREAGGDPEGSTRVPRPMAPARRPPRPAATAAGRPGPPAVPPSRPPGPDRPRSATPAMTMPPNRTLPLWSAQATSRALT